MMFVKIGSLIVAIVLLVAYLAPVVVKLKEMSLLGVILVGIVMMLVDAWQSIRGREA